jgi:hypothetical protein
VHDRWDSKDHDILGISIHFLFLIDWELGVPQYGNWSTATVNRDITGGRGPEQRGTTCHMNVQELVFSHTLGLQEEQSVVCVGGCVGVRGAIQNVSICALIKENDCFITK